MTIRSFSRATAVLLIFSVAPWSGCGDGGSGSSETTSTATLQSTTIEAYDAIATKIASIKTYATSASSSSETDANRLTYQTAVDTLIDEINDLADATTFDSRKVLQGSAPTALSSTGTFSTTAKRHQRVVDAINKLSEGNQTVTIAYSFVIAGTSVVDLGTTYTAVELKDHNDGSVTHAQYMQEIREALTLWEDLFEKVFNPGNGYGGSLQVVFTDLGDETGTSQGVTPSGGTYAVPGSENLGMFRYAVIPIASTAAPFSPTGNISDGIDDSTGEIAFSSSTNWRQDRQSTTAGSGNTSVKMENEWGQKTNGVKNEWGHQKRMGSDNSIIVFVSARRCTRPVNALPTSAVWHLPASAPRFPVL